MNVCAVDGCDRPRERRQWCRAHYQRWWRHGSTDDGRTLRTRADPSGGAATCWRCVEIAHLAGTDTLANIAVRVGLQRDGTDKRRREAVLVHLRRHGRTELADRLARLETARQEGAWV